ncbi:MFS transporter [Roseospira goensis]|uniref:PPP family 3-phenylpropionic acid transporter n=1 Tax=Roseospira goensis TaxID=391922 RepID=A0A7W6RXJ3_9PROT|nr:MFS transporter [Roseospira goensis]MBB4285065.1 PPP family 3-phenylpropionic acid transporter [Roseospira goensis]
MRVPVMPVRSPTPAVRVGLQYGAMFTVIGILMPFWPPWLESRGLGAVEIGVVMAASQWSKVLVNPVVGHWVDATGRRKPTMVALAVASLVCFLALTPQTGFWPLLLLAVPATACLAALMPLAETIALGLVRTTGADYGRMRLWGSLTFMVAAIGAGAALDVISVAIVPAGILGALVLTLAATLLLPGDGHRDPRAPGPESGGGLGRLLREPRFVLFLACAGLAQASHAPYYGFSTLHWRAAGLSETTIGLLWAVGVVAEIGLFAVSNRALARLGPMGLLLVAAGGGLLRWTVTAATTHPGALFAVQGLHALTFAAAHLGAMHFVARAVPQSHAVRAQGLYSALAMGALLGVAMMAAGWLYARADGAAFLLGTALSAGALGAGLLLARRWDGGTLWRPAVVRAQEASNGAAARAAPSPSPPSPGPTTSR